MPVPAWKDEYSINVDKIDEQHKTLIGIIRELYDVKELGGDEKTCKAIMKKLTDYTSYHFEFEEEYMESIEYPDINRHRSEHARLTDEVFEVINQVNMGHRILADDMFDFLNDWLINHILKTDQKIREFNESKK